LGIGDKGAFSAFFNGGGGTGFGFGACVSEITWALMTR
jgi:hypothetical protein